MVDRSSPGMYCRYSANSTLKPLKGLRCSPVRNPSTIVRARSSSVPRRATTAGSRNWREREAGAMGLHPALGDWNRFEQTLDDRVGVDALRFRVEIRHHAVPEDRLGERLDVLDRHVIAAVHERAGLSAAHERLRRAKTRTPLHPFLDEVGSTRPAGTRSVDKPHRVSRHFFG